MVANRRVILTEGKVHATGRRLDDIAVIGGVGAGVRRTERQRHAPLKPGEKFDMITK